MIVGVGIDILSLARISALVDRRGALALGRRICTPREYGELEALHDGGGARAVRFLSARWAAKEAAYKALAPARPTWKSLDLAYLPSGQPTLRLVAPVPAAEKAAADASSTRPMAPHPSLLTTISHDAGVVVAVVIAQT